MTTKAFYAQCRTCRIDWPSYTQAGALILSEHHATEFPGHECTVVERARRDRGAAERLVLLLVVLLVAAVVVGVNVALRESTARICATVTCEEKP